MPGTYTRKTRDEWQVHGYYAHGWEEVACGETYDDGRRLLEEYRENERGTAFRLRHKRVPIEGAP